jgi:ABC-type dipeptide/oligopeptide/nickel transport system ATPase component
MEEAVRMLKVVNIPDPERRVNGYQHEFSGGMKQRVMIALALSCHPRFLIADNPTTALDSTIQLQFLNLILELRKTYGMTILYITHDFGVVAKLCDRVAVLYAGQIIEIGSVFSVLKTESTLTPNSVPAPSRDAPKRISPSRKQPDLASLWGSCLLRVASVMMECRRARSIS